MRIYVSIVVSLVGFCLSSAYAEAPEESKTMTSWGNPVSSTVLERQRGGTDTNGPVTVNANFLNAKLYDNRATNNVTGDNTIMGGAFAGASGLPVVIQNSGNNVIIQNGTVLNLTMQ